MALCGRRTTRRRQTPTHARHAGASPDQERRNAARPIIQRSRLHTIPRRSHSPSIQTLEGAETQHRQLDCSHTRTKPSHSTPPYSKLSTANEGSATSRRRTLPHQLGKTPSTTLKTQSRPPSTGDASIQPRPPALKTLEDISAPARTAPNNKSHESNNSAANVHIARNTPPPQKASILLAPKQKQSKSDQKTYNADPRKARKTINVPATCFTTLSMTKVKCFRV
jgi:hypothetical protein